jgi:hypothetical protein
MKKNPVLEEAYNWTYDNKENIVKSKKCGCYCCLTIFEPSKIEEWWGDDSRTAACPVCKLGCTVIGSESGHKITKAFLRKMNKYWFAGEVFDGKPIIFAELE